MRFGCQVHGSRLKRLFRPLTSDLRSPPQPPLFLSEPSPFRSPFPIKYACSIPRAYCRVNNLFETRVFCPEESGWVGKVHGSRFKGWLNDDCRLPIANCSRFPFFRLGWLEEGRPGRPKPGWIMRPSRHVRIRSAACSCSCLQTPGVTTVYNERMNNPPGTLGPTSEPTALRTLARTGNGDQRSAIRGRKPSKACRFSTRHPSPDSF